MQMFDTIKLRKLPLMLFVTWENHYLGDKQKHIYSTYGKHIYSTLFWSRFVETHLNLEKKLILHSAL